MGTLPTYPLGCRLVLECLQLLEVQGDSDGADGKRTPGTPMGSDGVPRGQTDFVQRWNSLLIRNSARSFAFTVHGNIHFAHVPME